MEEVVPKMAHRRGSDAGHLVTLYVLYGRAMYFLLLFSCPFLSMLFFFKVLRYKK